MKITKAVSLAIKAIRKEIRRIAVDANFHDKYCADYPHAVQASKDRKKYQSAIQTLERIERTLSMLRTFQQVYTIDGALAANHVFTFKAPFDMQIVHVSLSNSSANAGTFDLGPSTDADGYADGKTFGVSAACTELDERTDFDGAVSDSQWPRVTKGTVVHVTFKDHASHMANACVILTFTEG